MKPELEPRKAVPPTIRKRSALIAAPVKPQDPPHLSLGLQIKREFRELGLVVD